MRHVAATDDHSVHRALVRLNPSAYAAACPTFGYRATRTLTQTLQEHSTHSECLRACVRVQPADGTTSR